MKTKKIRLSNIVLPSNILMAPLAGYTCYPFRILCYEMGAGLCFTEMISSNSLRYTDVATKRLLFTTENEKIKAIQLFGSDPRIIEEMARSEYFNKFDIIDINMGCPVPNIFKSGAGSALLYDIKRASKIIKGCRKSGKIVTVKFRVGVKENNLFASEFAKMCEDSGAEMITIHGRTRSMMYKGEPYYSEIEKAKASVSIPVIANGGIFSIEDSDKMMNLTGVDGIMIGRYALENPFVFSQLLGKRILKTKYKILNEQIELSQKYYDETFTLSYIKKIASFCMREFKDKKKYKMNLYQCGNIKELKEVIKIIFYNEGSDNNWRDLL